MKIHSMVRDIWDTVPEVRLLYVIFLAQEWRIYSPENIYYAHCRLYVHGDGDAQVTIDDLVDQWLYHGGLDHFRQTHRRLYETVSKRVTDAHFMQFQLFFVMCHRQFRELAELGSGHSLKPSELFEWLVEQGVNDRLRKRFDGIISEYRVKKENVD